MAYPEQLDRILGANYTVRNLGDSGKTMLKKGLCGDDRGCSGDCSYWDFKAYTKAIASDPDIVTIMLGTNDAKGCNFQSDINGSPTGAGTQFSLDYGDMIKQFKSLPSKPKVYVALPPPLGANKPYNMSYSVINELYPKLQRDIASKYGADGVIDTWSCLG
eukprot:UN34007